MGAALAPYLCIQLSKNFAGLLFVTRASDVVLPIFDELGRFCGTRGYPILGGGPLVPPDILNHPKHLKSGPRH